MSNGGPPNKFVFVDTTGLTPQQVADKLSELWNHDVTGPYVVVGNVIYAAGYPKQ